MAHLSLGHGHALKHASRGMGGVGSGTSRYYSCDVGRIHFIALDMNVYFIASEARFRENQLAWLATDLADANMNRENVPWIILCVLVSAAASAWDKRGSLLRSALLASLPAQHGAPAHVLQLHHAGRRDTR